MSGHQFRDARVAAVFQEYPDAVRDRLLALRALIFETAARTEGVGPLVETLKWGQPAYLPERRGTGTTVRIDALKAGPPRYALYVHCQTSLISTFREIYPDRFRYEGNRAIVFAAEDEIAREALAHCIAMALTYHAGGRARREKVVG